MTALILLRHAIGLMTQDPLRSLQKVGPAVGVVLLACVLIALTAPELLALAAARADPGVPGWSAFALIAAFVLGAVLLAILWHRLKLGISHALGPALVLGYLWRVAVLAVIQVVVSLCVVVPLLLASHSAGGAQPALPSILIATFISQLLVVWLLLRLSLILPAAAIGTPLSLRKSWEHTHAIARPLWGVAAVLALLNTAIKIVFPNLGLRDPVIEMALKLPFYGFAALLVLSVLTALYAMLVQTPGKEHA